MRAGAARRAGAVRRERESASRPRSLDAAPARGPRRTRLSAGCGGPERSHSHMDNTASAPGGVAVIGVRFQEAGKIYYFEPGGYEGMEAGSYVVVETSRG